MQVPPDAIAYWQHPPPNAPPAPRPPAPFHAPHFAPTLRCAARACGGRSRPLTAQLPHAPTTFAAPPQPLFPSVPLPEPQFSPELQPPIPFPVAQPDNEASPHRFSFAPPPDLYSFDASFPNPHALPPPVLQWLAHSHPIAYDGSSPPPQFMTAYAPGAFPAGGHVFVPFAPPTAFSSGSPPQPRASAPFMTASARDAAAAAAPLTPLLTSSTHEASRESSRGLKRKGDHSELWLEIGSPPGSSVPFPGAESLTPEGNKPQVGEEPRSEPVDGFPDELEDLDLTGWPSEAPEQENGGAGSCQDASGSADCWSQEACRQTEAEDPQCDGWVLRSFEQGCYLAGSPPSPAKMDGVAPCAASVPESQKVARRAVEEERARLFEALDPDSKRVCRPGDSMAAARALEDEKSRLLSTLENGGCRLAVWDSRYTGHT